MADRRLKQRGLVLFSIAFCGTSLVLVAIASAAKMNISVPMYSPMNRTIVPSGEVISGIDRGIVLPANAETTSARILFAGDVMLDREVANRMRRAGNLAYPFQKLPEDWIASFDFAVANLEGSVTDKRLPPVKTIDFQFSPEVLPMLKAQGFNAFSQANNHSLDQGNAGYADSVSRLRDAGFLVFGHQVKDDEIALATTTINGLRIAFLGFNTTDNTMDKNAAALALETAKAGSDKTIVFMHWGLEYRDRPQQKEVELAHWLIDHGADVVIGGHPHWEQGFSVYKGKPIAWSLGNFIFDQDWSARTKEGLAISLSFRPGETRIELFPLEIEKSQPELVAGADRKNRLNRLAEVSDEMLSSQIREGVLRFQLYGDIR